MPRMRNDVPGMTDMDDMLMGTMMDDLLLGGPGDDHLDGGGGSDVFDGGPGGDSIIGGDGIDYVSYLRSPSGVYVDIGNNFNIDDDDKPPVHGGYAEGDTLTEIEGVFGSVFGDTFRGDHQANYLFGYKGNDVIFGADGADYIRGETGGDSLSGDAGADQLFGDTGNDALYGGGGNDMLWGGKGNDVLYGGPGNDRLEGGEGADVHHGDTGADTAAYTMSPAGVMVNLKYAYDGVTSNDGEIAMGGHAEGDSFGFYQATDLLGNPMGDPEESINRLLGSMHDDMLTGSDKANHLYGGEGDDTLAGEGGNDILAGQMGDDTLMGGNGNDHLIGGPGADLLEGGDHKAGEGDTASYAGSTAGVMVNLGFEDRDGDSVPKFEGGDAEGDTNPMLDIENLTGSDYGDLLIGTDDPNVLMGGKGDDWDNQETNVQEGGLFGMGGPDTLVGGAGNDYLDGGAGRNDLWGLAGNDYLVGGVMDDLWLRAAADDPAGTEATIRFSPAASYNAPPSAVDDEKRGGLFGGTGDDTLEGGGGSDHIDGGSGNDTVSYKSRSHDDDGVTVNLGADIDEKANTGVLIPADPEAETPTPLALQEAGDIPELSAFFNADESTELTFFDTLRGIENVIGSRGDDTIHGNDRANKLDGGEGSDTLTGGGGSDTFIFDEDDAGAGNPIKFAANGTYTFNKDDGGDTVSDFSRFDGDKIDLSSYKLSTAELDDAIVSGGDTASTTGIVIWSDTNDDGVIGVGDEGTLVVTLMGVEPGDLSIGDFIL